MEAAFGVLDLYHDIGDAIAGNRTVGPFANSKLHVSDALFCLEYKVLASMTRCRRDVLRGARHILNNLAQRKTMRQRHYGNYMRLIVRKLQDCRIVQSGGIGETAQLLLDEIHEKLRSDSGTYERYPCY